MNNFGQLYGSYGSCMAAGFGLHSLCLGMPSVLNTASSDGRRREDGIYVTAPGKRGRVDRTGRSQRRDHRGDGAARGMNST